MNSNSAGGGGSINSNMKHSQIGVYLSEQTRAVAGTVSSGNSEYKGDCDRALEFYKFLIDKGQNYVYVPFFDIPSFGVKSTPVSTHFVNSVGSSILGRNLMDTSQYNETNVNEKNEISLSETFCFNEETKMNTSYLLNKEPGFLTIIGFIKINDVDTVWWVSTLQFKKDENGKYCLYMKAFCKNNNIQINSSRIGLDIILDLCEKFNNLRKSFQMEYCYLESLRMAITWWVLCGFQVKHPDYLFNTKPNRMERKFQQVLSSSSASFSVEAISSLKSPSTEIGSDEDRDKARDEAEGLLIEQLQMMPAAAAKEYKDTSKLGPMSEWGDPSDDDEDEGQKIPTKLEIQRKKPKLGVGGSKTNKKKKKSDKNKKKTNKNKTNKKNTNRKVKRSRRRTRRF
jgi:hypothetical protein